MKTASIYVRCDVAIPDDMNVSAEDMKNLRLDIVKERITLRDRLLYNAELTNHETEEVANIENKPMSKSTPPEAILIGRGILNWSRTERVSDRYGTVFLLEDKSDKPSDVWVPTGTGTLIALVTDPHPSSHIGDLFRGLCPSLPKCGERLVLGRGAAFCEIENGITHIGVRPQDSRNNDWLDPRMLYRCHSSGVALIWEPDT